MKIETSWCKGKSAYSRGAGGGRAVCARCGKEKLSDSWQEVPLGGNPSYRFFTVEVELP